MILLIIFIVLIITIITITFFILKKNKNKNQEDYLKNNTKCFVINLEKNKERLELFLKRYNDSDINILELQRYNAIYGKNVDIERYITEKAYKQILLAEENGYRWRHYQLTKGSIGCYLSHMALYKKLLEDNEKKFYIIFEDDAIIGKNVIQSINGFITNAPDDWDIMLFGALREISKPYNNLFDKVSTFWGLHGYAVSKQGAQKFINYIEKVIKIDMQIDSLMSYMTKNNNFNVYSTKYHFIDFNKNKGDTDIQLPIKFVNDIDPFEYENDIGKHIL